MGEVAAKDIYGKMLALRKEKSETNMIFAATPLRFTHKLRLQLQSRVHFDRDTLGRFSVFVLPIYLSFLNSGIPSSRIGSASVMRQAQWIDLTFTYGKGKHKTQLQKQKEIEALGGYIEKKAEYLTHLGRMRDRNRMVPFKKRGLSSSPFVVPAFPFFEAFFSSCALYFVLLFGIEKAGSNFCF